MIGIIWFHNNIDKIYKKSWIDECLNSMKNQDYSGKTINFEIDYSGKQIRYLDDSVYYSVPFENHVFAMNFIIDRCFEHGCEYVFNTNMDDFYTKNRVRLQVDELNNGYDLVSSDFYYIDETGDVMFKMDVLGSNLTKDMGGVKNSILGNHNVIGHPVIAFSKKFWLTNRYYEPQDIPAEDLKLWQKSILNNSRIKIIDLPLLFYRRHSNQITN